MVFKQQVRWRQETLGAFPGAGTGHREPPDPVTPQPQPSVEQLGSAQKVDIDTNFSYFVNPLFAGEAEAEA